jgi:hypothetical protein
MLKKSASVVLASRRDSTYRSVRLASSLAAALLDSLFEHPADHSGTITLRIITAAHRTKTEFCRQLLVCVPTAGLSNGGARHRESFAPGSPCLFITLTAASSDSLKELRTFLSGERFPCSWYQSVKRHMHDPNTMQGEYTIPYDLAHTTNLSIASFGEDDAESCRTESFNPAGFGRALENDDPFIHAVDECLIEWMID